MAATLSVAERCMALSRKVLTLGIGINSRRSAQEIFRQLSECANEFGSDMIALNYLPNRSMRAQQAVECVKCGQKVIYLLNLALREGMFDGKAVSEALQMSIVLENEANALVKAYVPGPAPEPAKPEPEPAPAPEPEAVAEPEPEPDPDPDGFDAPFEGDLN